MHHECKFTRPEDPLTPKMVESINAKTNRLLGMFKDFANDERREYRRHDITTRLVGAVMKAHAKFQENDSCSFESFADVFVSREAKHYARDIHHVIKQERATVSGDNPVDSGDDDSPSHIDGMAHPRDYVAESLDRCDFETVAEMLARLNPLYARVFTLRYEGYKLAEIHAIIGVPDWQLYDVLWPATREAVRKIYNFGN